MPFDKKIKQLTGIKKNIGKFISESVVRHSNILEDAITEDQLYEKGEDGKGVSLGEYSDTTKQFKRTIAGQLGRDTRIDHITLRDTGEFHKSVKIKLTRDGFEMDGDTQKDDTDLEQEFGEDILTINEDNLQDFRQNLLLDDLRKEFRAAL